MRNSRTGALEVYDVSGGSITSAAALGQVGLEWSVAGIGDFSGNPGESDLLMRNSQTGAFELYDISHNSITFAGSMGQVGPAWTVVGFGLFNGTGSTDMMMRNSQTGTFELYDISNNKITFAQSIGQVGTEWQVTGIGVDLAAGSTGGAASQLTQAMAAFAPANGAPIPSPTGDPSAMQADSADASPFAPPAATTQQVVR